MHKDRVAQLIQYALACAERDSGDSELGSIHLLKYVYIADLAHADGHSGQTYTGAVWRFHRFGPWAREVHEIIPHAAKQIGAEPVHRESAYDDSDYVRWRLEDESVVDRIERHLPFEVARRVRLAVKTHGRDTASLLDYVYRTRPMLKAAPREELDFSAQARSNPVSHEPSRPSLTHKEKKRRKQKLFDLRSRFRARAHERRRESRLVSPPTSPRFDEVYEKGSEWIETLAGKSEVAEHGVLRISDEIWHSDGRTEPDIP